MVEAARNCSDASANVEALGGDGVSKNTEMRVPEFKCDDQQERSEDQQDEKCREVQPPPSTVLIKIIAIFARAHVTLLASRARFTVCRFGSVALRLGVREMLDMTPSLAHAVCGVPSTKCSLQKPSAQRLRRTEHIGLGGSFVARRFPQA